MSKKPIHPIFLFDGVPQDWEQISESVSDLCKLIDTAGTSASKNSTTSCIHWNVPIHPILDTDRHYPYRTWLRARVENKQDNILTPGYSETNLGLLTKNEQLNHLHWSIHNPWKCGIEDIFHNNETGFFHGRNIEGMETTIENLFSYRVFICASHTNMYSYFLEIHGPDQKSIIKMHDISSLFQIEKERQAQKIIDKAIKHSRSGKPVVLRINLGAPKISLILDKCTDVIEFLVEKYGLIERRLSSITATETPPQAFRQHCNRSTSLNHAGILQASFLRQRPSSGDPGIRQILRTISKNNNSEASNGCPDNVSTPGSHEPRTLLSSMHGHVTLEDKFFSARFYQGIMTEFNYRENEAHSTILQNLFQPRMVLHHNICDFELQSAFSFETRNSRGLRGTFRPSKEEFSKAFILIDFISMENFPHLVVDCLVNYPEIEHDTLVRSFSPITVPICRMPVEDPLLIETKSADFIGHPFKYFPADDERLIYGNSFSFISKDTFVRFAFIDKWGALIEELPLETVRTDFGNFLVAKPRGFKCPIWGQELSCRSEKFSFILTTDRSNPLHREHIPHEVAIETGPQWIGRE